MKIFRLLTVSRLTWTLVSLEKIHDISIDAGNSNGSLSEFDLNGPAGTDNSTTATVADDILTVDGISYTFPGGNCFRWWQYRWCMLFTTACVYGGPSNTLDDCGNVTAGITGGGLSIGAHMISITDSQQHLVLNSVKVVWLLMKLTILY